MKNLIFLVILLSTACATIPTTPKITLSTVPQTCIVTRCDECDGNTYILRFQFNVTDVSTTAQDRLGIKFLYAGGDSTITMVIAANADTQLAIATIANYVERDYNNQK